MKKPNSIEELNQKVWYRLLKVVYIGLLIFLCGGQIYANYTNFGYLNDSQQYDFKLCVEKFNKADFFDKEAYAKVFLYEEKQNNETVMSLFKSNLTNSDTPEIIGIRKKILDKPIYEKIDWKSVIDTNEVRNKICSYKNTLYLFDFVKDTSIFCFFVLLVFGALRISFYYIIFGKISPNKS